GHDYVSPSWTPDGQAVLVSHNNGPAVTGLLRRGFTPFDLYLFQLNGGRGQRLTGGEAARGGTAQAGIDGHLGARFVSPHDVWFSSARSPQLYTMDVRSGEVVRRTGLGAGAYRPVPSPDGKWLVYATRHHNVTALRLRDLATDEERWLAHEVQQDQLATKPTRDLMPGMSFTPDGSEL